MSNRAKHASAEISSCGAFRYTLKRRWGPGREMLFIMLNPSTADGTQDDPTIRRCVGFARRERFGAIRVENLFAYRATSPDDLFAQKLGKELSLHERVALQTAVDVSHLVVAAWGGDRRAAGRAEYVKALLRTLRADVYCLGTTKSGAPRHPLYLRADTPLERFSI